MPMDGITIGAVVYELQNSLQGARIEKVMQPEKDELILLLRNEGENFRLLLSANANHARLHLTENNKQNPLTAPLFCMLLRKHLTGGKIMDIVQQGNERIVELLIDSTDELGELTRKRLILEIMGKYSNLILVNQEDIIIDSIKRVNAEISRVRQVLPGLPYLSPPSQGKLDPLFPTDLNEIEQILANPNGITPVRLLTDHFIGISIAAAKEIVYSAQGSDLKTAFFAYREQILCHQYAPCLLLDPWEMPIDYFPFRYTMLSDAPMKIYPSLSEALDQFFILRDKAQRLKERARELHAKLHTALDRCEKKKALQLEKLQECSKMDELRMYGEFVFANLYQIKRGQEKVAVINYYDPNAATIYVPLDPRLSPNANAQKYFKQYNKLKTASVLLTDQIAANEEELNYLQSQLDNLEKCTEYEELQEIRHELAQLGYISSVPAKRGPKLPESKPMHYRSGDGIDIYVGKNNTQNDRLTLHFAGSDNMWLHTKDIPGSHVIIRYDGQPPEHTMEEAALLAAYFSKGRTSANVPVDAALRKYVKKPSGALPGKVIYTNNTTLYVTPEESAIKGLVKVE